MWDEVGHGSTACDPLFTQIQPYNHDLDIVVSPSALRYNAYKALIFKKNIFSDLCQNNYLKN